MHKECYIHSALWRFSYIIDILAKSMECLDPIYNDIHSQINNDIHSKSLVQTMYLKSTQRIDQQAMNVYRLVQ